MEKSLAGELIHPSTSSPRASRGHGRQVHLYSGTPGRTVWAQSRQTNRPSLCAIIGLNSMPTMQWGHRMVNSVSVSVHSIPIRETALHVDFRTGPVQ